MLITKSEMIRKAGCWWTTRPTLRNCWLLFNFYFVKHFLQKNCGNNWAAWNSISSHAYYLAIGLLMYVLFRVSATNLNYYHETEKLFIPPAPGCTCLRLDARERNAGVRSLQFSFIYKQKLFGDWILGKRLFAIKIINLWSIFWFR